MSGGKMREVHGQKQLGENKEEDSCYRDSGHRWIRNERRKVCMYCGEVEEK